MVKIDDNLNFCQHFRKNLDLSRYLRDNRIRPKFPQILVLVKMSENVNLGRNLEICRSWSKFIKISKLVKNFKNINFWSKLSEIIDFTNMSILDKIAFKCYL